MWSAAPNRTATVRPHRVARRGRRGSGCWDAAAAAAAVVRPLPAACQTSNRTSARARNGRSRACVVVLRYVSPLRLRRTLAYTHMPGTRRAMCVCVCAVLECVRPHPAGRAAELVEHTLRHTFSCIVVVDDGCRTRKKYFRCHRTGTKRTRALARA